MATVQDSSIPAHWFVTSFPEVVYFQEGPGIRHWQYRDQGVPFVNIRCMVNGRLDIASMNCLDPVEVASKYEHFLLDAGDYVVSSSGTIGRIVEVVNDDLPCMLNTSVIRMRPRNEAVLDRGFLRYFLSSRLFQHQIESVAAGSVQVNYGPTHLQQMWIALPPLPEQRAIAHILGTLDDKIDLNRRMNDTLEQMAHALYKSWFVDFGPVRAKMDGRWRRGESLPGLPADLYDLFPNRLVTSELGEMPEGWEVKALESFGEIITGKTPSTRRSEYFGEDVPFLRIPDMHGHMYALQTKMTLSTVGADSQPHKTLPPGSISVSCIATPGLVVLNHHATQTNQQINSIIPLDQFLSRYLYWSCRNLSSDIETGGSGGSVLGNMNKSSFSSLPVLDAKSDVIRAFDQLVSPMHAAILANEQQNQTLVQGRDSLLPRLMSGKLRVAEMNIHGNCLKRA